MSQTTISRRDFMTAAASVGGLAVLAGGVGLSSPFERGADEEQTRFIVSVLDRYTVRTEKIKPAHIDLFAKRFNAVYGKVDYEQLFSGPIGEYKLVKFFLKSVMRVS